MLDAILFDLDGTLLPMSMEEFTSGYFGDLSKTLKEYNIPKETLVKTIWAGTGAMARNDGSCKNSEVFWKTFYSLIPGMENTDVRNSCDKFYSNEFKAAIRFTQPNPLAKEAVRLAHLKAKKVILATNPLFPMVGQLTRLSWLGLTADDFDAITSYENDSYCKPNPMYFIDLCKREGIEPDNSLMIGNDEYEDMYAGTEAGLKCFFVTDSGISSKDHPWNGPRGSFVDMVEMLRGM